jgi:hypothetical protein
MSSQNNDGFGSVSAAFERPSAVLVDLTVSKLFGKFDVFRVATGGSRQLLSLPNRLHNSARLLHLRTVPSLQL